MNLSSVLTTAVSTVAATTVVAFGFSSQALGLTFYGKSEGVWENPFPGSNNTNPYYTGVGTNQFRWGDARPNDPTFGTPPNQLTFEGSSFGAGEGSVFKIGDLTYFNGTVPDGTNVSSVSLSLNLLFTRPVNPAEGVTFGFDLINTTNVGTPQENADSVMVKYNFGDRSLTDNQGNQYLLELLGFSQDGGRTTVSEFKVLEGEQTTAGIYARITRTTPRTQVPEPATLAGLSVLSIYLLSRKNKFLRDKK